MPKRLDPKNPPVRIHMVASAGLVKKIDGWRSKQPGLPNRSEAMRLLIERGLEAKPEKPKGKRG